MELNNILSKIKLTSEFNRDTKSIEYFNTLKASELRNYLFYIGFVLFKEVLPEEHFRHYCSYIIAVRILTQV